MRNGNRLWGAAGTSAAAGRQGGAGRESGGMPAPPAVGPGTLPSSAPRSQRITMPTRKRTSMARGRPRPSSEAAIADCRRRAIAVAKRRVPKRAMRSMGVTAVTRAWAKRGGVGLVRDRRRERSSDGTPRDPQERIKAEDAGLIRRAKTRRAPCHLLAARARCPRRPESGFGSGPWSLATKARVRVQDNRYAG